MHLNITLDSSTEYFIDSESIKLRKINDKHCIETMYDMFEEISLQEYTRIKELLMGGNCFITFEFIKAISSGWKNAWNDTKSSITIPIKTIISLASLKKECETEYTLRSNCNPGLDTSPTMEYWISKKEYTKIQKKLNNIEAAPIKSEWNEDINNMHGMDL